jgi:integrase
VATVAQVYALADSVPRRFVALILMAAFTSLRYRELAALRRKDVNVVRATVTVRATLGRTPGWLGDLWATQNSSRHSDRDDARGARA